MDPDTSNLFRSSLLNGLTFESAPFGHPNESIDVFINNNGSLLDITQTPQIDLGNHGFLEGPGWTAPYTDAIDYAYPLAIDHSMENSPALTPHISNESLTSSQAGSSKRRATRKRRIENGYHCTHLHCVETYDTAGELSKHCFRKHTPESDWPFGCELCGKRFYDRRDHSRHMKVERKRALILEPTDTRQNTQTKDSRAEDRSPSKDGQCTDLVPLPSTQHINMDAPPEHSPLRPLQCSDEQASILDFYRPERRHLTAKDALAAAKSELSKLINLRPISITIKAVVPSNHELVAYTAVHHIGQSRTEAQEPITIATDAVIHPRGDRESHHPDEASHRNIKVNTNGVGGGDGSDGSVLDRASISSCGLSTKPLTIKAITVRLRNRPGYQRSQTHPGKIHLLDEEPPLPQLHEGGGDDRAHLRLWKGIRQVGCSGVHVHFESHLRKSRGLAWARSTTTAFSTNHPSRSREL